VGFGDGDPGQLAGQQAGQPCPAGLRAAVAGDEQAVSQSGGVAQVDVAVAAHELREHPVQVIAGVDVAPRGQLPPDGPQPEAAFGSGGQVRAHRVGGQGLVQRARQGGEPDPVDPVGGVEHGPQRLQPGRDRLVRVHRASPWTRAGWP
jgi:hypothetical protein